RVSGDTEMRIMSLFLFVAMLLGQGAPTDSWPTYNGDNSGRRYSTLSKINASTVSSLGLSWVFRATPGGNSNLRATIKSTPLVQNGVMYFTIPDHTWAIDARTGREIWHFVWQSKGGDHIGNRGAGIFGDSLYFETPDC